MAAAGNGALRVAVRSAREDDDVFVRTEGRVVPLPLLLLFVVEVEGLLPALLVVDAVEEVAVDGRVGRVVVLVELDGVVFFGSVEDDAGFLVAELIDSSMLNLMMLCYAML